MAKELTKADAKAVEKVGAKPPVAIEALLAELSRLLAFVISFFGFSRDPSKDSTTPTEQGPLAECPHPGGTPVVRAQFHVGIVVKGLAQTSLHRDGTNGTNKCQLWMTPFGIYLHLLQQRAPDIFVPFSNIEFVQLTDHPA